MSEEKPLPLPKLSPLPWAIDPDERDGMEWNVHIVERDRPYMRVCFMSKCSQAEANAALIVRSVNALPGLVKALEEIEQMPVSMVNDSESLRHSIKLMQHIAGLAIASIKEPT